MVWALVDQGGAALNAAGAGQTYTFPGGTTSAGDLLVLGISSNTTVSTPTGWSVADSDVGNLGAYAFYKKAAGGETNVSVTTAGNNPTSVAYLRYTGAATVPLDVVAHARSIISGSTTPAVTTPALAGSGELGIAFACLGGLQGSNQTAIVWNGSFTNQIDQNSGAFGPTDQHIFAADNRNVGAAAISPNATWTGPTNNQTIIVVTFKPSAAPAAQPGRWGVHL